MPTETPHGTRSDRLSGWRRVVEQARDTERYSHYPRTEEASILAVLKILLWLMGLLSCVVLAWSGTGGSVIVTAMIMLLPIAAWRIFGFSPWGLLLPIGLITALAMQGALLVW